MRGARPAALALVAALAPGALAAAVAVPGERWCGVAGGDGVVRDVARIEFVGNRVTRPEIMLRELSQRVGEPCSLDRIVDGVQSVMDLDLFRSVRAELVLEPVPAGAPSESGPALVLRYAVREKYFFLAIPRLSRTSDGELRSGLQLRWDNFTGRLHELRLTTERRQEDEGRGRSGYVHSIDYRVPRFLGSVWGAGLEFAAERRQVGFAREARVFGEGLSESTRLGVGLARWLGPFDGVRGLRAFVGVATETRELELLDGERGPFVGGTDTSLVAGVENRALHSESFRRRGHVVGVRLRVAGPWTGSDFRYHRADFHLAWYRALAGGIRNLNAQLRLGFSDGAPFGEQAYAIGGGELLRGVASGRDGGDVRALVNVEYLSAFFTRPEWRRVLFLDAGNVYPRDRVRPLRHNLRVGAGLRYKLRALTRTDLRLDVAWDPDEGRVVPYVATSLTF